MWKKIIVLNKESGETSLECINKLKIRKKELLKTPMTYAGRLDPLASGILLILVGNECLKKDKYLKLDKEYELTVLFGFSTDTYDILGKVIKENSLENFSKHQIKKYLGRLKGIIDQEYPPFSSKPVKGKPLFEWARNGKLDEIEIPSHKVEIYNIDIIDWDEISKENLKYKIENDISLVKGDFRQDEIRIIWKEILKESSQKGFPILKLRIICSSGTYVRGVANDLGGLALSIIRTRVGEYTIPIRK